MYDTILVATDGSDPAREAAVAGIELASVHGATVHGLYVIEPLRGGTGVALDAMENEGDESLTALRSLAERAGVAVETEMTVGVPHREIIGYAEAHDVDLVVVGTHGRSGLGRYLIGSVAERVVRLAECPVLTVRPDQS